MSTKPPPGFEALPTFIIIGAMKAGTSSLYHYLRLHPEVAMAAEKELAYFVSAWNWKRGEAWYRGWFDPSAAARGEASPQYTCYPQYPDVPERMHALLPDVRLLYVVRDPVERLVSHYRHNVAKGIEQRPLADALDEPDAVYLVRSQYYRQIERFLRFYERDQLLIVDQADLRDRRRATLQKVFAFLGVDPLVWDIRYHREHHRTSRKRILTPAGERLAASWPMQQVARLPEGIRWLVEDAVYWPFSEPVPQPELTDALQTRLASMLQDDVARWRAFTDQAYAHWSL